MNSNWRSKSRSETRLMLSLIFAMICLVAGLGAALVGPLAVPAALSDEPEHKYDGDYKGKRSLTKGTASTTCPAEDDVSVTITGETLTFTSSAVKNYLMPFDPSSDGSFGQTHTDVGGGVFHYHGRIIADVMDATVENPHCEYHWHLKKD